MFWNLLLDSTTGEGGDTTTSTGCSTQQWIIYGILFAVIIAFFVWSSYSSKKRQKQEQEKLSSLKIGDKVKTIGGICGVVANIDDEENTFTLETGFDENKSYVKFDKAAIYQTSSDSVEEQPEVKSEKVDELPVEENAEEKVEEKEE